MSGNSSSVTYLNVWNQYRNCMIIFIALFICYILLIPLCIYVLYLGFNRWRKQRSGSTSDTSSHSDIITYNIVVMEMICVLGSCFYANGLFSNLITVKVALYLWDMTVTGQNLFHILTCIERYLAVVHPVVYLRLRQSGGVRIRNISIGCVWLISVGSLGLLFHPVKSFLQLGFFILSFITVCFCSLSVLRVLILPGPGDVSRNRGHVDQSKKRAFQSIMIILLALVIRLLSSVVNALQAETVLQPFCSCELMWTLGWLSWPSSLVLPLLFLHRAGKLPTCKTNTKAG